VSGLAASHLYHHLPIGYSEDVQKTLAVREVARGIRNQCGAQPQIIHVDSPFALQFYLNSFQLMVQAERAAKLPRSDSPAYLAVSVPDKVRPYLGIRHLVSQRCPVAEIPCIATKAHSDFARPG
jgi:hypothetical protein